MSKRDASSSGSDVKGTRTTAVQRRGAAKVGYGNPPKSTRFRKGQSGNPGGRPKGARNKAPSWASDWLDGLWLVTAKCPIQIRQRDRAAQITTMEAVLRSVTTKAIKGDPRAQNLVLELADRIDRRQEVLREKAVQGALGLKLELTKELERRERLG